MELPSPWMLAFGALALIGVAGILWAAVKPLLLDR